MVVRVQVCCGGEPTCTVVLYNGADFEKLRLTQGKPLADRMKIQLALPNLDGDRRRHRIDRSSGSHHMPLLNWV